MTHPHSLSLKLLLVFVAFFVGTSIGRADERTLTPEQLKALEADGELDTEQSPRPAQLPDLTKGQATGEREKQDTWHLGPTGIIGYMVGGLKGDQIEVSSVLPGSPAQGKLRWGDVILGVGGQAFKHDQNMGVVLGNAIIEAEKEENAGLLTLKVWRDKNFTARNGKKDIAGADVDTLIDKAQNDPSLYDWKPEDEKQKEVRSSNFDEFPIDAEVIEVTLKLDVLPPYSDTSPYDCPKAQRIRENAWKVIEQRFREGKVKANRNGTVMALALVASGKPEHRELVRAWVRSPEAKAWHPSVAGSIDMNKPRGFYSWFMSFDALDCAIYYDATGDDFVLPALREYAVKCAMGQAGGGSWGHTFAWPAFNGGELHGMNPGYGALNAAGNRCFMLIALAKHLGIDDPEIDLAIERGQRFFGSYVDKGAVPYGHHGAAATDDSNGKNVGVAFALKMLGDTHGAKYFAQMSTHASFTRRGGHGNDYFWHYSPWAATLCGPKGTIATHRNLRWRFTLARRFDGAFVIQSPTGGLQELRDPTATFALHYSAPLKQTLWTGKDADPAMFWSDEEFDQLMASALPQLSDPVLIEQAGTPWRERSTDELFKLLSIFKPKARGQVAEELGVRYSAGDKQILPRLAALMQSGDARLRDGACRGLRACGTDATLEYLSAVAKLLNDPEEFVRMQAADTMASASNSPQTQLALLKATVAEDESKTMSPNSLSANMQSALFGGQTTLADSPFEAGLDDELVEAALEKLITLDPTGNRGMLSTRQKVWDKDTVARVAGPVVFAAEQEQIADQMFSSRRASSLSLLERLGYQESVEAGVSYLRQYQAIPRDIRPNVTYKRGLVDAKLLMRHPAVARPYLDELYVWMLDKPLAVAFAGKDEPDIQLYELIRAIEAQEQAQRLPSLADDAGRLFQQKLDEAGDGPARVALCRATLSDTHRKNYFHKMGALRYLVESLGEQAWGDLLPYLHHEHWRVQQLARALAVRLAEAHGDASLVRAFSSADERTAVGILAVLAEAKTKGGRELAEQTLSHASPALRAQAIQTLFAIAGDEALPRVFDLIKRASDKRELIGCESALRTRMNEPALADRVRSEAVAMLRDNKDNAMRRETLYWLIAQCGGPESLAVLGDAAQTADDGEFLEVVNALSYCPDLAADQVLLDIIKRNAKKPRAELTARHSVRRMVIGEAGVGKRSIPAQLDWAEGVLQVVLDDATIAYLGRVRTGRCAYILQDAMRRGAPTSAARAIIAATADLSDAPQADRKLAERALIDTIEFIEVTYLRGGVSERMKKDPEAWRTYPVWKTLSAEAGKNLLKLANPEKQPLPEFDDLDIDL